MKNHLSYVIFFECKAAPDDGSITKDRQLACVINEPEGWVAATSYSVDRSNAIPGDAKIFTSVLECDKFMDEWKGHPWYRVPNGTYKIVLVKPRMVTIQQGWEVA